MRIGIVIPKLIISGGSERQALALALELGKRGHEVTVFTSELNREKCYPATVALLSVSVAGEGMDDRSAARVLAATLPLDLDLVNGHDGFGAEVAYRYRQLGGKAKTVIMLNDLHIAQWSLFDDPAFGKPPRSLWKRLRAWLIDTKGTVRFLRFADRICVLNNRTRDIVKKYIGRNAVVVRSGVDAEQFLFLERNAIPVPKIRLLAHGIFYIHRRYEDIIEALALVRAAGYDAELGIIGDFTHKGAARAYHKRLLDLVAAHGLGEQVRFRGVVSDEELKRSFHEHDIFVSSSHMQTWGLAVFEAMASGIPVIVSDTVGASEVLTDHVHAMIVPALSPGRISQAVIELSQSPDLYRSLSVNGNRFVRERISWENYCDQMLSVYMSTLT